LGFSELVYPGATHTRFAHSIGVFHTARQLMRIIERHVRVSGHQYKDHQAHVALAAALLHDLGHGMFSHAFEDVGKRLNLKMAQHEHVSDALIRDGEVSDILRKEMGSGFANDVADVIKQGRPGNLYDAVVSSQFDADRLDYMQRDRMMTGVQNSGIDFNWLVANLEIGRVATGVDQQVVGDIETFVLSEKASYAAETYVLALFQLYPTVYLHKATRAAEKLFSTLMIRLVNLVRDGAAEATALPSSHPIVVFATEPDSLDHALALDDSVFWGAVGMLTRSRDPLISECARRLRDRRLPKRVNIRQHLRYSVASANAPLTDGQRKRIERLVASIGERLESWSMEQSRSVPRILTDRAVRDPYKTFQESKGPLNQIHIRGGDGGIVDVSETSSVIRAIEPFELFCAYVADDDTEAREVIHRIVREEIERDKHD
jgi:hypothetical protein